MCTPRLHLAGTGDAIFKGSLGIPASVVVDYSRGNKYAGLEYGFVDLITQDIRNHGTSTLNPLVHIFPQIPCLGVSINRKC